MAKWHKIMGGEIVKTVNARKGPTDIAVGSDGNPVWRPEVEERPAFDDATEVLEGPETIVEATQVVRRVAKRLMTAEELADSARQKDERLIRTGLIDLAEIVIEHVDAHVARGNITVADFNAATGKKYQDLKILVGRLRDA